MVDSCTNTDIHVETVSPHKGKPRGNYAAKPYIQKIRRLLNACDTQAVGLLARESLPFPVFPVSQ